MAPRDEMVSSLPGLWKYPTYRDHPLKSSELWLKGKQVDDGAEGLWRIHDELYDLSQWVHNHPGGSDWLTMTKGTDITEAFESYHLFETAERLLPHFHVRRAASRRNSPYTFHEDGFYRTLKRDVRKMLKGASTGPSFESKLIADLLCGTMLLTATLAAALGSYLIGFISGIFLAFTVICAHNFFHQKDNFRMYYFDLSLMSSRALLVGRGHWDVLRKEQLLSLVIPAAMYLYGGSGVVDTLLMWGWVITVGSFSFGVIGLNGGHHSPGIFHDGDAPREDRDWGLNQLDAVRDRKEISTNIFLVLTNFGHHSLHHLFPTVDHSRLVPLYPILEKTCAKFGVEYSHFCSTVMECLKGQFQQLALVTPNQVVPHQGKTKAS